MTANEEVEVEVEVEEMVKGIYTRLFQKSRYFCIARVSSQKSFFFLKKRHQLGYCGNGAVRIWQDKLGIIRGSNNTPPFL